MITETGEWDIRLSSKLINLFPDRTGFWFRPSPRLLQKALVALSRAYRVKTPTNLEVEGGHLKDIFAAWYRYLESASDGKYISDDDPNPTISVNRTLEHHQSYAKQFSERLFYLLRASKPGTTAKELSMPTKKSIATESTKALKKGAAVIAEAAKEEREKKRPTNLNKPLSEKEAQAAFAQGAAKAPTPKPTTYVIPDGPEDVKKSKVGTGPKQEVPASKGKGKAPEEKEEPTKKGEKRTRESPLDNDSRKFTKVEDNPRREGTLAYRTFQLYKVGRTVAEFRELCRTHNCDAGYLKHDIKNELVKLSDK